MRVRLAIIMATVAVVAAACGDSGSSAGGSSQASPTTQAVAETTAAAAASASSATGSEVSITDGILVDAEGLTLYLFTNDPKDGTSVCNGGCAQAWPPLEGEVTAGGDVDASKLGTITREDGSVQATYNDWPLYFFAGDSSAGEANGQASGGVWFTIDAAGVAIK